MKLIKYTLRTLNKNAETVGIREFGTKDEAVAFAVSLRPDEPPMILGGHMIFQQFGDVQTLQLWHKQNQ